MKLRDTTTNWLDFCVRCDLIGKFGVLSARLLHIFNNHENNAPKKKTTQTNLHYSPRVKSGKIRIVIKLDSQNVFLTDPKNFNIYLFVYL